MVIVCASEDMWRRLCQAMAAPELLDDPRFIDIQARLDNLPALIEIIEAWLAACDSDGDAILRMQEARVPCAPVLSVAEAMVEPHLIERQTVRTVEDPTVGRFQIPGMPLRFSGFPANPPRRAPYLGEHNEAVLMERLGYTACDVEALRADGILHAEPLPAEATR